MANAWLLVFGWPKEIMPCFSSWPLKSQWSTTRLNKNIPQTIQILMINYCGLQQLIARPLSYDTLIKCDFHFIFQKIKSFLIWDLQAFLLFSKFLINPSFHPNFLSKPSWFFIKYLKTFEETSMIKAKESNLKGETWRVFIF